RATEYDTPLLENAQMHRSCLQRSSNPWSVHESSDAAQDSIWSSGTASQPSTRGLSASFEKDQTGEFPGGQAQAEPKRRARPIAVFSELHVRALGATGVPSLPVVLTGTAGRKAFEAVST